MTDEELVAAYLDGISPPAPDQHEAHLRGLRAVAALRGRPEPEGGRLTDQAALFIERSIPHLDDAFWQGEARKLVAELRAALRDAPPQDGERLTEDTGRYVPYYCPCEICQKRRAVR
jgi:hypothetical protein